MREDTNKLLQEISSFESVGDFLFVGGSALAFQAKHRISEDLDFGFIGIKLPEDKIKDIVSKLSLLHSVSMETDVTTIQEADNKGVNLLEHQQDWLVDEVKVSFFTLGEGPHERKSIAEFPTEHYGHVRVLGLEGLFFRKCLLLMKRVKAGDIFDIWWFTEHGRSVRDVFNTIQNTQQYITYEYIRYRLLNWPTPLTDKGLELIGVQLDIGEVRNKLRQQVNMLEVEMASEYVNKIR